MSRRAPTPPMPGAAPLVRQVAAQAADGGAADAAQRRAAAARRGHPGDRAGRRRRRLERARPRLRPPRGRRVHAGGAGAGGDVDRLHLARDRDRLRASVRRDQAARLLPAAALRAARRQGRARCWLVEALQVVVLSARGVRPRLGPGSGRRRRRPGDRRWARPRSPRSACSSPACSAPRRRWPRRTSSTCCSWPAARWCCPRRRTAPSASSCAWLPSGALGDAMREALIDGTTAWRDLGVLARLGRARDRS